MMSLISRGNVKNTNCQSSLFPTSNAKWKKPRKKRLHSKKKILQNQSTCHRYCNHMEIKLSENAPTPMTLREFNGYTLQDLIGDGAFARVYACHNKSNEQYAMKVIRKQEMSQSQIQQV